ncbi:MAG: thioredoxin family protein [Bacteroidia bacterium]|nr:thioredoxin family protein [Bacteroidia bacterium]
MRKIKNPLVLFLLSLTAISLSAQMNFEEGSWAEAKAKAAKEHKFIFVDAYASWCGPCKWMAKNVFTNEEVGDFYNKNFVNFKIDMEKGEGPELDQEWKVNAYPTYLYFNGKGELVHRTGSAKEAPDFIQDGKNALDPETQLGPRMKRFADGDRDPEFLRNYALMLSSALMDTKDAAEAYLKTQKKSDLNSAENWAFIQRMVHKSESEEFKYVAANPEAFAKVADGRANVDDYIMGVLDSDIQRAARSKDEKKLDEVKKNFKKIMPSEAQMLSAKADYYFYSLVPEKADQYANIYLNDYCKDWSELNTAAWNSFKKYEDETHLKQALKWADKSIGIDKNWYNTDTKANLLLKLGQPEEALKVAEESMKIGDEAGEDTHDTDALIRQIRSEL